MLYNFCDAYIKLSLKKVEKHQITNYSKRNFTNFEVHSFPRATISENFSLLGTDSSIVSRQNVGYFDDIYVFIISIPKFYFHKFPCF